jgi:prepilin-type N-terminal cleavage/methylation domain-containing protein
MLQKLKKRKEAGFTIIEVLIVLAIAGLIMLVVFLAVPSLQRNSRNTQYRNEATRLIGAYNEASANNAGAVLNGATDATTVYNASNAKNVDSLTIEAQGGSTAPTLKGNAGATSTVDVIRTGAKCSAPNLATTVAGSTRQVVILYKVETSSGTQDQCQEA